MNMLFRVNPSTAIPAGALAMAAAFACLSPASADGDSRWHLVAEANSRVAQIAEATDASSSPGELEARVEEQLAPLKAQCHQLPAKIERAPCLDDMMRLITLAKVSVNPDEPGRNRILDIFHRHRPWRWHRDPSRLCTRGSPAGYSMVSSGQYTGEGDDIVLGNQTSSLYVLQSGVKENFLSEDEESEN